MASKCVFMYMSNLWQPARTSNYLGVHIDEFGSSAAHAEARLAAFKRADNMLSSSLYRILAYSHALLRYLWTSLVAPVGVHGMCACSWTVIDARNFAKAQCAARRTLLKVGGRAPQDIVQILMATDSCEI